MIIELRLCTDTMLDEIADKGSVQKDIAQTYHLALRSSEETNWSEVNRAIIKRWSRSGLERIKEMAWSGRCFKR